MRKDEFLYFNPLATPKTIRLAIFQSTRPVRGETIPGADLRGDAAISIHSPRAGRDPLFRHGPGNTWISIHSPHMGRDETPAPEYQEIPEFQSTRPIWGETGPHRMMLPNKPISIHSPHMGRDIMILSLLRHQKISIHSPHMGRDCKNTQYKRAYFCKTQQIF